MGGYLGLWVVFAVGGGRGFWVVWGYMGNWVGISLVGRCYLWWLEVGEIGVAFGG